MDKFEQILKNISDYCVSQGGFRSCNPECRNKDICIFLFGDEIPINFREKD